jgi:hypothetical protein
MSNTVELYYLKVGEMTWYFDDISRKGLIEQGIKTITEFMQTKPSRKEFDQHPGIQRILREVPECRQTYQKHIRESVVFESHKRLL